VDRGGYMTRAYGTSWASTIRLARIIVVVTLALATSAVCAYAQPVSINQQRVVVGRITPGDTGGFPVTITKPGSYKLTSNLIVPDPNLHGIEVTVSNVSIDLDGFAIIGPGGGDGTAAGVYTTQSQVAVINGSIRDMAYGMFLNGTLCRVEDVSVAKSTRDGIVAGEWCVIQGSRAAFNGGSGFVVFPGVAMSRNTTSWNKGFGIAEQGLNTGGSSIVQNVIEGNEQGRPVAESDDRLRPERAEQ